MLKIKTLSDNILAFKNIANKEKTWGFVFNKNVKEIEKIHLFKDLKNDLTIGLQLDVTEELCHDNKMEGGALISLIDNITNLCLSHFFPHILRLSVTLQLILTKDITAKEKIYFISSIDDINNDYVSCSCKIFNEKLELVCRGQQIMSLIKNKNMIKKMKEIYYKK